MRYHELRWWDDETPASQHAVTIHAGSGCIHHLVDLLIGNCATRIQITLKEKPARPSCDAGTASEGER